MSDIPTDLIDKLAAEGARVVYLPPKADISKSPACAEGYAVREDVRATAEAYFDSDDRLHGDRVAETSVLRERPIHRAMIYLSAAGKSIPDIASQTGYSTASVSQVLRQPWARLRLVQILKETGEDEVKHFLKNEVSPSLVVLRDIRDDPKAKNAEKIASCNAILDRALGKPTLHVESENTNRNVPADVQRLDAEIAAVRKQLADKNVDTTGSN